MSSTGTNGSNNVQFVPIDPAALATVSRLGYDSFHAFSLSVAQEPEFPSATVYENCLLSYMDLPLTYHCMAVAITSDDSDYYVEGVGHVLGSVIMVSCDDICTIGPITVRTSTHSRGIGRTLMQRCMDEANRMGKPARLCNIVANIHAFSLYVKLGFVPREYTVHMTGRLHPRHHALLKDKLAARQWVVREMQETDLEQCNKLFIETNNASRMVNLRHNFESPFAIIPPSPIVTDTDTTNACTVKTPAFVVVNGDGRVVGYTDGYDVDSHWLGIDEEAIVQLYHHSSQSLAPMGYQPDLHVIGSRYPQLLQRLMDYGAKATRQVCLMAYGQYQSPQRNVYCPSIMY